MLRALSFCPENVACASPNSDRHLCPVSGRVPPPRLPGLAIFRSQLRALLGPGCPTPGRIHYSCLGVPRAFLAKTLSNIHIICRVTCDLFQATYLGLVSSGIYSLVQFVRWPKTLPLERCFLVWLSTDIRIEIYLQYINLANLIKIYLYFLNLREQKRLSV